MQKNIPESPGKKKVVFRVINKPWMLLGVTRFLKVLFSVLCITFSEA